MEQYPLIDWLKERLQQPLPGLTGQLKMMARVKAMPKEVLTTARPSAVLCVLYPINDIISVLLIKRVSDGKVHSGQIAFPGGKQDSNDADLKATALREANEEVGIISSEVDILGSLTPLYIPVSNFQVYPFVAFAKQRPVFNLGLSEVADIIEIPIAELLHADRKTMVNVTSPVMPEILMSVRAYKLDDGILWGATAMIISELETIMEEYVD